MTYAWAIEYGDRREHVAFVKRTPQHDRAYVEQYAARLHGVIVELTAVGGHAADDQRRPADEPQDARPAR